MLGFFIASGFINAISFTVIGLFVLLINFRNKSNQVYALFSAAVAAWAIGYAIWLSYGANNEAFSLFWSRELNTAAIFIPMFFFHWVLILTGEDEKKGQKIILAISYLITFFFAAFGFSPYYVNHVEPKLFFPWWPMPGALHPFYLFLSWGVLTIYTWLLLLKAWRSASGYKKQQFKYLLISMPIGFGGGFTNFFLWYGIPFAPWANILVSVWGLSFIYIVFRYRFMDIYWILGRTGVYLLSFVPVILWASAFTYLLNAIRNSAYVLFLDIIFALGAVLIFYWSFAFFEKAAGRYFYYTLFNLKQKLLVLSKEINQMIDLNELSNFIVDSLVDALKIKKISIVLKDFDKLVFYPQKAVGITPAEVEQVIKDHIQFLEVWFRQDKGILTRDEIPFLIERFKDSQANRLAREKLNRLGGDLSKNGIAVLMPLFLKENFIGLIMLGEKEAGKLYSEQELDLLRSLVAQASVAFNNSLSYDEIEKRKKELEKFYQLTIGRELRMAELKDKIKQLEIKKVN